MTGDELDKVIGEGPHTVESIDDVDIEEHPATEDADAPATSVFMKPCGVSEELAVIVGTKPLSRTDITKKIWDYIKANGLQDKENRRNINCDDALAAVMGKPVVSMFEMTKLVQKHLRDEDGRLLTGSGKSSKKKSSGKKKPAAVNKSGKQPSLINATQSELLKNRLKKVEQMQLGKTDPDENRDEPTPCAKFIVEAIRTDKLVLKTGDALKAAVMDIFSEGEAEFDTNYRAKSETIGVSDAWEIDFALLFEAPDLKTLKAEFAKLEEERSAKEKALKAAVRRVVDRIQRAIASGTNTGAEVTAMIDEFEQMTFGGE